MKKFFAIGTAAVLGLALASVAPASAAGKKAQSSFRSAQASSQQSGAPLPKCSRTASKMSGAVCRN